MPPLPEAIILVFAPFAPLFSQRVWLHAQTLLLGLRGERHLTRDHRVLNRATWSARQGRQMLFGLLVMGLVSPGATGVLGADATVERRAGRKINANGGYREAVRSSKSMVFPRLTSSA